MYESVYQSIFEARSVVLRLALALGSYTCHCCAHRGDGDQFAHQVISACSVFLYSCYEPNDPSFSCSHSQLINSCLPPTVDPKAATVSDLLRHSLAQSLGSSGRYRRRSRDLFARSSSACYSLKYVGTTRMCHWCIQQQAQKSHRQMPVMNDRSVNILHTRRATPRRIGKTAKALGTHARRDTQRREGDE